MLWTYRNTNLISPLPPGGSRDECPSLNFLIYGSTLAQRSVAWLRQVSSKECSLSHFCQFLFFYLFFKLVFFIIINTINNHLWKRINFSREFQYLDKFFFCKVLLFLLLLSLLFLLLLHLLCRVVKFSYLALHRFLTMKKIILKRKISTLMDKRNFNHVVLKQTTWCKDKKTNWS